MTSWQELLRNQIDLTRDPFSDRGSRLLIYQHPAQSCLIIKLAERLAGLEPRADTQQPRPPFIQDLYLINENGESLEFKTVTYPNVIYFQTVIGKFRLAFQALQTLAFGLHPNTTAGLRFHVSPEFWRIADAGGEIKAVRNLAFATNGKVIKNQITPDESGFTVEFIVQAHDDCAITLHLSNTADLSHQVLPFSETDAGAEVRWDKWFEQAPPVAEPYRRTYAYAWWVMANNLISPMGFVAFEAMMPSKASYLGLWLWDSAMHAIAYRHVDSELARNQIRAMLIHQLSDGMLPDAIFDEDIVSEIDHPIRAKVTKPPILAWAALKLHKVASNLEFLREIYAPLVR